MGLDSVSGWTAAAVLLMMLAPAATAGGESLATAYVGAHVPLEASGMDARGARFCWVANEDGVRSSDVCWNANGGARAFGLPDVVGILNEIVLGVVVAGREVCVMVEGGNVQGCTAMEQRSSPEHLVASLLP